jgi:hypothetical protein
MNHIDDTDQRYVSGEAKQVLFTDGSAARQRDSRGIRALSQGAESRWRLCYPVWSNKVISAGKAAMVYRWIEWLAIVTQGFNERIELLCWTQPQPAGGIDARAGRDGVLEVATPCRMYG